VRRAIVTGAAGFIGSHLSERLIAEGYSVTGIDAFTDYYDRADKLANLTALEGAPRFDLVEGDLNDLDLAPLFAGAPVVFHLAAQPGVRLSFGEGFARYTADNILATQRVLEAASAAGCPRVVWASSSSVYGDAAAYPCVEATTPTAPRSPYGVTKRACEDLAAVYGNAGLSTAGLRYFTVYGPRQRPDMFFRRVCERLLDGGTFQMYGTGEQSRSFTYVGDVVAATRRVMEDAPPGALYNVGGGEEATNLEAIAVLEEVSGRRLEVEYVDAVKGDMQRTNADVSRIREDVGWEPQTSLRDGLAQMWSWAAARVAAE